MMRFLLILLCSSTLGLAFEEGPPGTFTTDGTEADTQAAIDESIDGEIILLPEGGFAWANVDIVGKGITLRGAGAGQAQIYSSDQEDIGTGSKVFTALTNAPTLSLEVGMHVRAWHSMRSSNMMFGVVTDWDGSDLTVNVTNTIGSGTGIFPWVIESIPSSMTIITNTRTSNGGMLAIGVDDDTSTIVEDITFYDAATAGDRYHITVSGSANAYHIIRRNHFINRELIARTVTAGNNHSIFYSNTFDVWENGGGAGADSGSIGVYGGSALGSNTWSQVSTMGTDDVGQTNNMYVEFNSFNNHAVQGFDGDNGCKAVIRHNMLFHSTLGTHGTDTTTYGNRHLEVYFNAQVFVNGGNGNTPNIIRWLQMRGGTGLYASNYVDELTSVAFGGTRSDLRMAIYVLSEGYSGIGYGCWHTNGESMYPATFYPAIRQVGYGYVDGMGGTNLSGGWGYSGDIEPFYVWGNINHTPTFAIVDGDEVCLNKDAATAYIQVDSDIDGIEEGEIIMGEAKPDWAASLTPHPLNVGASAEVGSSIQRGQVTPAIRRQIRGPL